MNITRGTLTHNRNAPATDAADTYLVSLLQESGLYNKNISVLIVNERYGGVVLKLPPEANVTLVQQFYTEQAGLAHNAANNGVEVSWKAMTEAYFLMQGVGQEVDVVLWRIPRNKELVHAQADCISRHCHGETLVYGASMIKYTLPDFRELIKAYFGHIRTLAMRHKALAFEMALPKMRGELPDYSGTLNSHGMGFLCTFPGVFSRNAIDLGTKELLRRIRINRAHNSVADVGCGYGAIARYLYQQRPDVKYTLVDNHFLSVECAKRNVLFENVRVEAGDFLEETNTSFDTIVCNVPFHDGHLLDRSVAKRCLQSVFSHATPNGEVWLVANAGNTLKKYFPSSLRSAHKVTVGKYEIWHLRM